MQEMNASWDGNSVQPLSAESCPTWNAVELGAGERGFDALGQTEFTIQSWCQLHGTAAKPSMCEPAPVAVLARVHRCNPTITPLNGDNVAIDTPSPHDDWHGQRDSTKFEIASNNGCIVG